MPRNTMKNVWKDKQKDEDRLNRLHEKKNQDAKKPENEGDSTDTSADRK